MSYFGKQSYVEMANQIPLIQDHFIKRKVTISKNSRYYIQFEILKELASCNTTQEYQVAINKHTMGNILAAFREVNELYTIINSFEHDYSEVYISKIKQILKGKSMPDLDEKDTQPRNITFELSLAAFFKKINYKVELTEPDIKIADDNLKVYIACKRIGSHKGLEDNVRKARKQICKQGSGLIALSLDKIINPDFSVLQAKNTEQLPSVVRNQMHNYIRNNQNNIQTWAANRKVVGIIYSFDVIIDNHEENCFYTGHLTKINNFCSKASPYFAFMKGIEPRFNSL